MLRTRAEIDAEPRLMQFLVEQACPQSGNGLAPEKAGLLPLPVWVMPKSRLSTICNGDFWYACADPQLERICEEYQIVLHKGNVGVCSHMGKLIE